MRDLAWALRSIRNAPRGPRVAAFFDLDGTLVRGYTGIAFLWDHVLKGEVSARYLWELAHETLRHRTDPTAGLGAIEKGVELLAGRELSALEARADEIFRRRVAQTIRPEARTLVRAHKDAGHRTVMASAATRFQAEPVARDLGIDQVLATAIQVREGRATGKIDGPPRWGGQKARAIVEFAQKHGVDPNLSFAYGNGVEDREFLHAVGRPVAVRPDTGLTTLAEAEGIPMLHLADPGERGLRNVAGTLRALGTFNLGLAATLAASAVVDKRTALPRGLTTTADLALSAAGVRVHAQGREHVDAARPAVFIFNHQSSLDPLIVASLVRRNFTGVGKAEVARDPRTWAMQFMDIALIDRSDTETARLGVAALVARIRGGESVLIAPEGTRMPTPTLGRFKRGAFHLAYNAQVPLVPIVIRNAGELWPPGTALIASGVVDVCILPPVPTTGWSEDDVGQQAETVRSMFEATLAHWPNAAPRTPHGKSQARRLLT